MKQAIDILLMGSSVFMDGVANCLEKETSIHIIRFDDLASCWQSDLRSLPPDLIVFELESLPAGELVNLMSDYPDVQWMALDPHCSQVSVINSRRYSVKAMKDLLSVIQTTTSGDCKEKGGKWAEHFV